MTYLDFIEHNDWEGETWHFYIPMSGNEENVPLFRNLVEENNLDICYEFGREMLTEQEVDILVKRGGSGYMSYHNKLEGILNIKALQRDLDTNDDPLYKGGIDNYLTKPHAKTKRTEIQEPEAEE